MLSSKVPWSLGEVLVVHLLRLLLGLLLVSYIFPALFAASQTVIELTDRITVLVLVWLIVRKHGGSLAAWGLSTSRLARNAMIGIVAGFILLGVSIFSERIYTAMFLLTPTQHPLIVQVENATSLNQLAVPLFLASIAAPVAEELLYRLFTFTALKERFGLWIGAVLSAAIFALFHFNLYWLAELVVVGLGLALVYYWTGSLISAIVAHSFVNTSKILLLFLNY
jgi:membrane protease YdiL (CAAX protease family)